MMRHELISRLVNPGGAPTDAALRRAIAGKTVLVTGASFGIGEACAQALGAAGAHVLVMARSRDRLSTLAEKIRSTGGVATAYPVDLSDVDAVAQVASRILDTHGALDVLVSNAGKSIRRSLALSYDRFCDIERTIGVNYLGAARLVLALLPSMRARGRGHLINIATIGSRVPPGPRWGAYQASKTAFDVWFRSAGLETRVDGVVTTSIYMALVYTRMSAPTPIFQRLPGLHPAEAAGLVARAIVDQPRVIAPWWIYPAELISVALRAPLEALMERLYRLTADTPSAAQVAERGVSCRA
jgi:NAD(P)-dependent dehydrogenase (short-subunit alcohol dehydrogenase family)